MYTNTFDNGNKRFTVIIVFSQKEKYQICADRHYTQYTCVLQTMTAVRKHISVCRLSILSTIFTRIHLTTNIAFVLCVLMFDVYTPYIIYVYCILYILKYVCVHVNGIRYGLTPSNIFCELAFKSPFS